MKIHSIHVEGFLGARQVDIALVEPITLIAGQNGAGKSSIANAIALALNAELGRVDVKKDAARLVTEGATAACVQIQTDSADFEVHITKAGKITDHAAGRKPHPALPFALDASRFSRLPDAERRTLLFNLLGIETTPEAIAERLARMKCDADKVKAIGPALRAGFVAGEKHARELASQARGKWVAVTGEKAYGDKKAEGWEPPPAAALAGDPAALAENASARANELGERYVKNYFATVVEHYEIHGKHFSGTKGYEFYASAAEMIEAIGLAEMATMYASVNTFGTPDQIVDKIAAQREILGCDVDVLAITKYGGMTQAEAESSMRLFADEVSPRLRATSRAAA